jgi:hypothetical protein
MLRLTQTRRKQFRVAGAICLFYSLGMYVAEAWSHRPAPAPVAPRPTVVAQPRPSPALPIRRTPAVPLNSPQPATVAPVSAPPASVAPITRPSEPPPEVLQPVARETPTAPPISPPPPPPTASQSGVMGIVRRGALISIRNVVTQPNGTRVDFTATGTGSAYSQLCAPSGQGQSFLVDQRGQRYGMLNDGGARGCRSLAPGQSANFSYLYQRLAPHIEHFSVYWLDGVDPNAPARAGQTTLQVTMSPD